jgi:beta-fructofuranosidase
MPEGKRVLCPVLDGEFWLVGASPDLANLLPEAEGGAAGHECVDHHAYQDARGVWHLWGCIRRTSVGRLLYHWEAESLTQSPWRQTGEIMRVDRDAGESLDDWYGQEWVQSPFVVKNRGLYYMFYGGHGTGVDAEGRAVAGDDPRMACQMCLMTSPDGRHWSRYRDTRGYSRLFVGPGETRDPCLLRLGDVWYLYHAGYHNNDPEQAGFYARTSRDLLEWSDWMLVHQDRAYGAGRWNTECPHVVCREGSYYLFRTADYRSATTHVFQSDDPLDFGVGDASGRYVGRIAVAAPEIIVDEGGREYITSNHDLLGGTQMCRLTWVAA